MDELQSEIEREYGKEGVPPPPADARKKTAIKLRKKFLLKEEFRILWERIKHKTRYAVHVDSEQLIAAVDPDLDEAIIHKPRIVIAKAAMQADDKEDFFEAIVQSGARTAIDLAGRYPLPNLIEIMENLMENTSPPMRLSRKTLLAIYKRTKNQQSAVNNPHGFAVAAVGIIKDKLADQLVSGIKYEKDGKWYDQSQFLEEVLSWKDMIVQSKEASGAGGTHLYDGVIYESETIEKPFAVSLEKDARVKLYVKLPDWFMVDTPIGTYNPDWAIVMQEPHDSEPVLYLVRETNDPLRIENSYDDTMPSLNVSFLPSESQIIRLALARTIARAPLDNMNAGFGVFNSPPTAFGGNPELEPFRADQIDLTYEHYFGSETALTFGVFYKDIDTFIVRLTRQNVNFLDEFGIDLVGLGLAATNIGTYTQPGNGEGGYIAGAEVSYQQPLTFLPAPFDGLGVYANYTYVESDVQLSPEFVTGSFPLPGLSENNVNLTLWYYKAGFEARVAYRYRDAFATELGDVPDQILYTDAEAVVDFQTSYEFPDSSSLDGLKLLFQIGNVTDEPFQTYYGIPEARGRYESFGRRYWWGISYEF